VLNSLPPAEPGRGADHDTFSGILRAGPLGAVVLAAIATAIVLASWFAFYLFVFLPRGAG
jgi:hypothetical protein